MLIKDYYIFLKQIILSEKENVLRLLKLVIMGSFLMFFVALFSNLIKVKIDSTYAGRYVLLPYLKSTQEYEHSLSLNLIDQTMINHIQNKYDNTKFLDNEHLKEMPIYNITQNESAELSYDINHFEDKPVIAKHILEMYQWDLNDFYKIDSTLIEFHESLDIGVDMLLPEAFDHEFLPKDNQLITIQTGSDIDLIVEEINQNILSPLYEYRLEDFSMDELLIAIVGSIEKILLLFSFLIFSVSSSNIGTVMPYFVNEFKDEINLLCLMGLSNQTIFNIFMLACIFILGFALLISLMFSYLTYILFALVLNVTLKLPFIKLCFVFCFQLFCGCFFSFQSIKKATIEVTYL